MVASCNTWTCMVCSLYRCTARRIITQDRQLAFVLYIYLTFLCMSTRSILWGLTADRLLYSYPTCLPVSVSFTVSVGVSVLVCKGHVF